MELGFKAMKIRSWRPDPMDDVAVVRAMKEAVGDRMDIMVDRTANGPGSICDFGTAYRVARALEEVGAAWLEEPFMRGEVHEAARLNEVVDIPITGGEGDYKLEMFREYLKHGSYDTRDRDSYLRRTARHSCKAPHDLPFQPGRVRRLINHHPRPTPGMSTPHRLRSVGMISTVPSGVVTFLPWLPEVNGG